MPKYLPIVVVCLCAGPGFADPPVGSYLFPAGGQRGKTVEFHAGGLYLNQACSLEMIGPGVQASPMVRRTDSIWLEGPVLPIPESQRQEDYPQAMACKVAIAADASPGLRYVLLRTSQGITSPMRFVVGDLPEMVEEELPGSPVPVLVRSPLTINGRIFPHEDIDIWTVALKKGQVFSAWVDAERIGSPLQAKLNVRGPSGELIAESLATGKKDPRVTVRVLEDGVYSVAITDTRANGGPAFVYRLSLTAGPVVEHTFPLGGRRGTKLAFKWNDSQLGRLAIPLEAKANHLAKLEIDGEFTPAFELDVDDLPETREQDLPDPIRGNHLRIPSIGNGRIELPGEVDRWGFFARQGELLEIELRAHRLGSPLLGVLSILDAGSKEIAKVEPNSGDPSIDFKVPADGLYFVTVRDRFRARGGRAFAYRLRIVRPAPDFSLSFTLPSTTIVRGQQAKLKVTAIRHGTFNGPIGIQVNGLPTGVKLAKAIVLAANQKSIDVPIVADASAKIDASSIQIEGTGLISLAPFSAMFFPTKREATWSEDESVDRVRLAVAVPTPFKIAGNYELKLIPRGTVHTRKYRIERNGFAGPIEIELADKQARHLQGVTGPKFVVPGDKSEFEYPITLPPWMETGRTCRVCVMGTSTVKDPDGTEHVVTFSSREQNDQIIAVVEPERLGLRLERNTVLVQPGSSAELKVEVRRGEGLKGKAVVEVVVPRGIKGVSAKSIRVEETDGVLKLHFAANATGPFAMPLTIRSTVMDGEKPVTAERTLELVALR